MLNKVMPSLPAAVAGIGDGATLLIGGFGPSGVPTELLRALLDTGARELTIVNNNAAAGQVVFHAHLHLIPRREGDGLHLWPGSPYADAAAMETMAQAVRQAIASGR